MRLIRRHWNRRDFIRAAGVSASAAALLPLMPSIGDAQDLPTRLLLITTGNGTILEKVRDNGSGAALRHGAALPELRGPILAPLDRHREKLIILDGIDMASRYTSPSGGNHGHHGQSILWTGRNGGGVFYDGHDGRGYEHPNGPSIDQVIADRIGSETAVKSVQLISARRFVDGRVVNCYTATGGLLVPQNDPRATFDRLFRDYDPTDTGGERRARLTARRQRTFGLLRGEIGRLRGELHGADRDRFDQHVASVDALEERVSAMTTVRACTPGAAPPVGGSTGVSGAPVHEVIEAQLELIATAFACDRTRVVNWMMTPENVYANGTYMRANCPGWVSSTGVHNASHLVGDPDNATARAASDSIAAMNRWQANYLAELLDRLEAIEDAPGVSALDNTVVVWGMGMSQASRHTNRGTPMVIAQGANGPFDAGRYLRFGEVEIPAFGDCRRCGADRGAAPNNEVLVSILRGFGIDVDTFGDPMFRGELEGLR